MIPVAAIRDNDETIKCKYLIHSVGLLTFSSFSKFFLGAPYGFIHLVKNIHKSISLFGDNKVGLTNDLSTSYKQTKQLNYVNGHYYDKPPSDSGTSTADGTERTVINFGGQQRYYSRGRDQNKPFNNNRNNRSMSDYRESIKLGKRGRLCINYENSGTTTISLDSPKMEKFNRKAEDRSRKLGFKMEHLADDI